MKLVKTLNCSLFYFRFDCLYRLFFCFIFWLRVFDFFVADASLRRDIVVRSCKRDKGRTIFSFISRVMIISNLECTNQTKQKKTLFWPLPCLLGTFE